MWVLIQCIAHVLRQDTNRMLQIFNLEELVTVQDAHDAFIGPHVTGFST